LQSKSEATRAFNDEPRITVPVPEKVELSAGAGKGGESGRNIQVVVRHLRLSVVMKRARNMHIVEV